MKKVEDNKKNNWVSPKIHVIQIKKTLGNKASGLESNCTSNNGAVRPAGCP